MRKQQDHWCRNFLGGIMLLLLWFAMPLRALATYVDELYNYNVNLEGVDKITMRLPLYDTSGADCWIKYAYIYVQVDGEGDSSKKTLLYWKAETDIDNDHLYNDATFSTGVNGTVQIIRDIDHGNEVVGKNDTKIRIYRPNKNQNFFNFTAVWNIPNEYRGKKVKLTWSVRRDGNRRFDEDVEGLESKLIEIPSRPPLVTPELLTPMLAYERANAGKIMVPWMVATSTVYDAKLHYTPYGGSEVVEPIDTASSGFIYFPMETPVRNCYISVKYKDTEKKDQTSESVKNIDMPILHTAQNLHAFLQPNGTGKVTWSINYPGYKDVMESDMWEIQRCIGEDANEKNWLTIGQLGFDKDVTDYSYEDENLFSVYQSDSIRYRVRRASTAIWGWEKIAGVAYAVAKERYFLPYISNATVTKAENWGVNDEHKVNIQWETRSTPLKPYDMDGRFIIRSREDWQAFAQLVNEGQNTTLDAVMYADVNLGTLQDMVGTLTSPYKGTFDGNGHTLTVNYVSDDQGTYSSGRETPKTAPFAHVGANATIKNLRTAGTILAKRQFASGLVGWVLSGNNEKTVSIQSCQSSVIINSTVDGDGSHGGFISVVDGGPVLFENCMFDGSIIGPQTHSSGGFVGYTRGTLTMNSCLFAPQVVNLNTRDCQTFYRAASSPQLPSCYYTTSIAGIQGVAVSTPLDLNRLLASLGENAWELDGDFVRPQMQSINYEVETQYAADGRIILRNASDWVTFADLVDGGMTNLNAIMVENIDLGDVQTMVGLDKAYCGDFDGGGHTLTVAYTDNRYEGKCAPFVNVGEGCSIHDLHVKGSITGLTRYVGGIIASSGNNVSLKNCVSDVAININAPCPYHISGYAGGLIGYQKGNVTITDCAFYGSITSSIQEMQYYVSGIVGRGRPVSERARVDYTLTNVLSAPTSIDVANAMYVRNVTYAFIDPEPLTSTWVNQTNCYYTTNTGVNPIHLKDNTTATEANNMSATELAGNLGSAWSVYQDRAMPIGAIKNSEEEASVDIARWDDRAKMVIHTEMISSTGETVHTADRVLTDEEVKSGKYTLDLTNTCVDYQFRITVDRNQSPLYIGLRSRDQSYSTNVAKTERGEDAVYEFNLNGELTELTATPQQSSVLLKWTTNDLSVDYFRVLRRDKADPTNKLDTLVTNYQQVQYTDNTVLSQHNYIYRVEAVVDCEGLHQSALEEEGHCEPTGMVCGYVRLADGTAVAGATVTADVAKGSNILNPSHGVAVTDETGYFEIAGLVYQTKGSYTINVSTKGNEASYDARTVEFTEDKNLFSNVVFYSDTYYIYSGTVMYDGTSIPVLGAQFLLDGKLMTKSSGPDKGKPVTTNSSGEFSLSLPQGNHQVQVVKDGHVFDKQGFIINHDAVGDQTVLDVQANRYQIYLWDKTRVILRGRVVGGVEQGNKPLGKSLSTNNLGDSIRIVMQLEGDNVSWIVRDQKDETIKMRNSLYAHGLNDTTRVVSTQHTITIAPDNKTGEYEIPFIPTKYKVTDIYCNGYATLFQAGKVGETLDLSNYGVGDTITYNRIYHKPATLAYEQFTGTLEKYLGIKSYKAQDNIGQSVDVTLWSPEKGYSLGHPVFMAGNPSLLTLSAREEYFYNNVEKDTPDDIVLLSGGTVYMHNGLIGPEHTDSIHLDSLGQASYLFTPENVTFVNQGDDALRSLTFTLLYDATYYDIKPLKAYVMAVQPKSQGKRLVVASRPHLIDILRDPPGGKSSAYIEAGSKINYGYTYDINAEIGVSFELGVGKGSNYYEGIWAGDKTGTTAGNINSADNYKLTTLNITTSYFGNWSYEYEFVTKERIETGEGIKKAGEVVDIYIGATDETVMEEAIAVRAVPESMYKLLVPATGNSFNMGGKTYEVSNGTVKVLAEGTDEKGQKVYLIRDEVMQVSSKLKTTFVHSEIYIEKELIPQLFRIRESLMLPKGTTAAEAKAYAKSRKHPVYVSLVAPDDPTYAFYDANGNKTYTQYVPEGTENTLQTDSISALNEQIRSWIGFLATNEQEKLMVTESDKVKTYSFDGGSKVEYSESFAFSKGRENYMKIPLISGIEGLGDDLMMFGNNALKQWGDGEDKAKKDDATNKVSFSALGTKLTFAFKPVVSFDFNYKNTTNEENSKETGFTLACDKDAFLTVDVYRTKVDLSGYEDKIKSGDMSVIYKYSEEVKSKIRAGALGTNQTLSFMPYDTKTYSNFVFRTRGGATKKPYEDARLTEYYNPGLVLDEKTIPIDNLRIWTDQATVSNVPYGEPARFTIHLSNESEVPNMATPYFQLCRMDNDENAKGAKIYVDGVALSPNGIRVWMEPNTVVDKQVEVYAGTEFDYNNLTLCIWDPDDEDRRWKQNITAHFLPSAGKVNIASPDDKWVLNTESPYNKDKQSHYMPVRIDGFNVNARGFDHIELQYKLSTEGDKSWVNVCSYYKSDSLMALASGERKLIKNDGYIDDAIFYGEKDPVEQNYDLRAVVYCRHAGGFIMAESDVLSGVKDTRIPVPFGTPKPVSGILDIGDDIIISFSEPIAGNYLSKVNNFSVLGTTNSSNITLSTALRFEQNSAALTKGSRDLAGKDFTFDLMIHPDDNGKAMTVLSHGRDDHHVTLGVTADRKLMAIMDGKLVVSDKSVNFTGLHQVVYAFQEITKSDGSPAMQVTFFDGSLEIGKGTLDGTYNGNGGIMLGMNAQRDSLDSKLLDDYEGGMLELRLWSSALTSSDIQKFSQKSLTGYELNLIDNYALNEGEGIKYSYDKAVGGSDLELFGTSWIMPKGISLALDGETGIKLKSEFFDRDAEDDYTLMFWFRTDSYDGTLMANGLAQDEANNGMHFNVGVEEGELVFRSAGQLVKTGAFVADAAWHHFAVTINRARNVGNIYIDQKLKQTFPTVNIGGINGEELAVGATYTDAQTTVKPLKGNIDEIGMYEMVLPENLIKSFTSSTPTGREMGTMVYLTFSRSEKLDDNSQQLTPIGISLHKYRDNQGKFSETRQDTIVAESVVDKYADRIHYARMREKAELENLEFSYVVDGQNLLLNLDVPEPSIEKTNVYITVKDVADLNGNLTASPVLMDLYVYRNSLRWDRKQVDIAANYGEGAKVEVKVKNLSGKRQNYSLVGMPIWITPSKTAGVIDALHEETITLEVSPYINIGDYSEKFFLVGESGMTEPLPVNIVIRGERPAWTVSDGLKTKNITMNMIARVRLNGNIAHDPDDMLAVYGDHHQLLGVTNIDVDQTASANEGLAYLTIYNNADTPTKLDFEFFDSSTGKIYEVEPDMEHYPDGVTFKANTLVGSSADPVVLEQTLMEVQTIRLKKGWNWLSFYVERFEDETVSNTLDDVADWEVGDAFEVINSQGEPYQYSYKSKVHPKDPNQRIYFWDHGEDLLKLDPRLMYRFYSKSDKLAYISGLDFSRGVTVKHGWNRVGYISAINLPISVALTDYTDNASEGDIIKSQDEFAVLNIINGVRVWKGTLKYLRAGEGYMIKRQATDEYKFYYPDYTSSSRYAGPNTSSSRALLFDNDMASNMNVIAVTDGIELEAGDRLVAYHGAEVCGVAEADEDGLFFLTVAESGTRSASDIQFTIEREGEVVAMTGQTMAYQTDALIGSVPEPTVISFISTDGMAEGEWYTLQGIRLPSRPATNGAYIYNGKIVYIK